MVSILKQPFKFACSVNFHLYQTKAADKHKPQYTYFGSTALCKQRYKNPSQTADDIKPIKRQWSSSKSLSDSLKKVEVNFHKFKTLFLASKQSTVVQFQ